MPGILRVLAVARVWVGEVSGVAVLVADGILVDRSIGLGCAVVGRRDAITGFTAIVAVPVVHSAVWVFICKDVHGKRRKNDKGRCLMGIYITCQRVTRGPGKANPAAQC